MITAAVQALTANALRESVVLRVDGGMRSGRDVLVAAALGGDEYGFGTVAMIATGRRNCCVRRAACRGCCAVLPPDPGHHRSGERSASPRHVAVLQAASWRASATRTTAPWGWPASGRSCGRASPATPATSSTTSTSWRRRCAGARDWKGGGGLSCDWIVAPLMRSCWEHTRMCGRCSRKMRIMRAVAQSGAVAAAATLVRQVRAGLAALGLRSLDDLVGRADLLKQRDIKLAKTSALDLSFVTTYAGETGKSSDRRKQCAPHLSLIALSPSPAAQPSPTAFTPRACLEGLLLCTLCMVASGLLIVMSGRRDLCYSHLLVCRFSSTRYTLIQITLSAIRLF